MKSLLCGLLKKDNDNQRSCADGYNLNGGSGSDNVENYPYQSTIVEYKSTEILTGMFSSRG
jgi:hypothetical protein